MSWSRLRVSLAFALLATACSGGKTAPDGSSADTATPTTSPPACERVAQGDGWEWSGACIGMTMGCEIATDGCALTVTCSGMDMGLPETAIVDGENVVFDDGPSLSGCVGTVEDRNTLSGTCDGGCTWTLEH